MKIRIILAISWKDFISPDKLAFIKKNIHQKYYQNIRAHYTSD